MVEVGQTNLTTEPQLRGQVMKDCTKYVGLDVHKDTIAVSIADAGRSKARFYGVIENTPQSILTVLKAINPEGEVLGVCYEAGPCGYGLYRQLSGMGHDCEVVAPSLIPRRGSSRVKTDRRDSLRLAELCRAGELTPVWVPDEEQEAIRDLVRTRDDFKGMQKQVRQRLLAFLLRLDLKWTGGKKNWTKGFWHWVEGLSLGSVHQQFALKEYIEAARTATARIENLEKQMYKAKQGWQLEPLVDGLMAMRGVNLVTAMGVIAELGDLSRFAKASQLMSFLGLVPSEHSSGQSRHQGGITRSGNAHVRRLLTESAWCYRFSARRSREIVKRGERTGESVRAIAWKAQRRLCKRYRELSERGLASCKVVTAVARELAGFIWAVVREARESLMINPTLKMS